MAQLISVRSNQDFSVDYEDGKLIPQTEIILLIETPKYTSDKKGIKKAIEIKELRFKTGSNGINALIGQLQMAQKVATNYEQMAGALNSVISEYNPTEDLK